MIAVRVVVVLVGRQVLAAVAAAAAGSDAARVLVDPEPRNQRRQAADRVSHSWRELWGSVMRVCMIGGEEVWFR
jgi:NAD(P)H-hydrate repair Nnr-like enzyme with NAD(P)H-hydrate dehydratase domain